MHLYLYSLYLPSYCENAPPNNTEVASLILFLELKFRKFCVLYRNNIGHASTCNTAGQTIGVTIGSVFSVLFTSEDFCNRYMRSSPDIGGIVTMKGKSVG